MTTDLEEELPALMWGSGWLDHLYEDPLV